MERNKTKKLTETALMIALSIILTLPIFSLKFWPQGGSVTIASAAPIIYISCKYNVKWGVLTSLIFAALQMILGGLYAVPTENILPYIGEVLLDYVIAYGVIGLAGFFFNRFKNKTLGIAVGTIIVLMLRFVCHFLSGIIIWSEYAPEGQSVFMYSLTYNGSYMVPEIIITTIVMVLLSKFIVKQLDRG